MQVATRRSGTRTRASKVPHQKKRRKRVPASPQAKGGRRVRSDRLHVPVAFLHDDSPCLSLSTNIRALFLFARRSSSSSVFSAHCCCCCRPADLCLSFVGRVFQLWKNHMLNTLTLTITLEQQQLRLRTTCPASTAYPAADSIMTLATALATFEKRASCLLPLAAFSPACSLSREFSITRFSAFLLPCPRPLRAYRISSSACRQPARKHAPARRYSALRTDPGTAPASCLPAGLSLSRPCSCFIFCPALATHLCLRTRSCCQRQSR